MMCVDKLNMKQMGEKQNQQLVKQIFERFDKNGDYSITAEEFKAAVMGDFKDQEVQKIMKKMRRMIDISDEDKLKEEFDRMDTDKSGKVDFNEFKRYMQSNFKEISFEEINAVFQRFAGDGVEMELEMFVCMLREDYLNMGKIKEKITEFMRKHQVDLRALFDRYAKDKKYFNIKDLENFLQYVGIKVDSDMTD